MRKNALDTVYRQKWAEQVDAITKQFSTLPQDRKPEMIDGYTSMSRAREGFDWNKVELSTGTRRVFFVAGNESPLGGLHGLFS